MCVIALIKDKSTVTKKNLKSQWDINSDGGGVCYVKDEKLEVVKGLMTFDAFYSVFKSIDTNKPFVYHLRLATHGKMDKRSTHPFKIGNKILFHNGVMHKLGNQEDSDTIELCNNILKHVPFKYWEKLLGDIDSSRFLVMYLSDRSRLKIIKTGNWTKYKNNLYSNMHWADSFFNCWDDREDSLNEETVEGLNPDDMLWKNDHIDSGFYEAD